MFQKQMDWSVAMLCVSAPLLGLLSSGPDASAAAKTPSPGVVQAVDGIKTVMLAPVNGLTIQLPDGSFHDYGGDLLASLTTQLTQSGRYLVVAPDSGDSADAKLKSLAQLKGPPSQYSWAATVTPAITVRVEPEALSFETGLGGEKIMYGFNERISNIPDEFPLNTVVSQTVGWFGNNYDRKGIVPFDSQSGLDLGDGFQIDALYAWLTIKYAHYHAELRMKVYLNTPINSNPSFTEIEVKGDGFYFDAVGGYESYSAGIRAARKDAMDQAIGSAIRGTFGAVDRALSRVPLMARVDAVLPDGMLLLGTGISSQVRPGVLYQVVSSPQTVIEVSAAQLDGSLGKIVQGNAQAVQSGVLIEQIYTLPKVAPVQSRMLAAAPAPGVPSVTDTTQLAAANIPQLPALSGYVPNQSRAQAFLQSVVEGVFLPYRIWRYFQYNQAYHRVADGGKSSEQFSSQWKTEPWVSQIGLSQLLPLDAGTLSLSPPVVVAVIDSGVDYNHPWIHDSIWSNPSAWKDPSGRTDRYGWDFISNDARPYDDGYHGTEVASVVTRIAPRAKVMPLKVFNPWGVTHSSAIYSAMIYAVDHGAKILLCPWATRVMSQAIENGVQYAQDHDVLVVAAAGDGGVDLGLSPYSPAVLTDSIDHLVVVTAVDAQDQLVKVAGHAANFGLKRVQIAAPGQNISVAEPRLGLDHATSTSLASAMVAGGLARWLDFDGSNARVMDGVRQMFEDADRVSTLTSVVEQGRRLHLRR